ncbi:MAG: hypothetical protein IPJ88_04570 [Myxococcales bacterium]|nr:MAG: hypothetical protein IPJ88_04570 [Myxococcales bacterium]
MNTRKIISTILVLVSLLITAACSESKTNSAEDSGSSSSQFDVPELAPIVREATPEHLRSAATANASIVQKIKKTLAELFILKTAHAQNSSSYDKTTPKGAIEAMFKDTYNKLSGGSAEGIINAAVEDLDARMSEINQRQTGTAPCLAATAATHDISITGIDALSIQLDLQCSDSFDSEGDMSGPGSGMAFGQSGSSQSLWLYLNQQNDEDRFGYFATVQPASAGSDKNAVDFVMMENFPSFNRISGYRVKANAETDTFEVNYAASTENGTHLHCGMQMISDGTMIWVEGKHVGAGPGDCADASAVALCFSAADMSELDSSDCASLASSFTMTGFTPESLTSAGDEIASSLPVANASNKTQSFTIVGPDVDPAQ